MRIDARLRRLALLAALASAMAAGRARAQFGFGYGFGMYYQNPASPEHMLNQWALQNGQKATMGPVQDNVYANNPNAYINHLHDESPLDRYDVGTRRTIEASIGRYSDGPPPSRHLARASSEHAPEPGQAASPSPAPPASPIVPLSSFFDRYQKLVWPGESPDYGDLGAKRAAADQACLAALNDYNLHGLAQVGTVTEARSKLIDYGRPALQYIRDNSTPRVADTFHLFLLSLYESLSQAATIPKPPAATPVSSPAPPQP